MPDVRCTECGNIIRVQGLAATCPHCGNLVIAGHLPRPTAVQPPATSNDDTHFASDPNQPLDVAFLAEKLDPSPDFRVPLSHADQFPEPEPARRLVSTPSPDQPIVTESRWQALNLQTWQIAAAAIVVFILFALLVDWIRLHASRELAASPTIATNTDTGSHAPLPASAPPAREAEPTQALPTATPEPPPAPSPVPTPAPATAPAPPSYPFAGLANILPSPPKFVRASKLTDQQIGDSLHRGVEFLLNEFSGSRLRGGDSVDADTFAGRNALGAYALLHAGQSLNDVRVTPQSESMRNILTRVKDFPMDGNRATYSRSLRLGALSVYNRPEDRGIIESDATYLIKSSTHGRFTYGMIDDNARLTGNSPWDNSNSQYGALGLWFAADAGSKVPNIFWSEVEQHWVETQSATGGWGYNGGNGASLAMTAAGVTSLFVARDQMIANASDLQLNSEAPKAIRRGIEWLDEGDNVLNIEGGGHPGYALYGLERAGLASGYRFFGRHDWYLELAQKRLAQQQTDGSWTGGSDGTQVETAFSLLFLSRGRHPILLSKLRFDGNWQNNPRDLEYLTRFASQQIERPLNWQIVDLDRPWQDWSDSGLLYLASDKPPTFSGDDVDKLRSYIQAGGLLFTESDNGSPSMNEFASELAKQLFPDFPLTELPDDHPIYSAIYPQKTKSKLMGVSNGVRLLMVHSPVDLSKAWARRNDKLNHAAFETGMNVAVYSTGRREFRNRLESLFISDPVDPPIATVPLARIKYDGNWDAEPAAWMREAKAIETETRIHVEVKPIEARDLTIDAAPIATLCVVDTLNLQPVEIDAIRQFVSKGGVLLVDAMGGSKTGSDAINTNLIAKLVPGASAAPLSATSPLLVGGVGFDKAAPLKLRPFSLQVLGSTTAPNLRTLRVGNGQVIVSDLDLTSGLLGTATWGIVGYQPSTSHTLAKNVVIWSMRTPPR